MGTEEFVHDEFLAKLAGIPYPHRTLILQAAERLLKQEGEIVKLEAMLKKYAPCVTCKHYDQLGCLPPCRQCLHNIEERPGWELREE